MKCFHCEKGAILGRSHTHHRGVAGGRWKKRAPKTAKLFRPNLQPVKIMLNGIETRVKLCTKCLKRIKKDLTDGKKPFLTLVNPPKIVAVVAPEAEPATKE
ncbi:MAG: hypothetical protein O3B87_02425 [bacterium]|nr:hypothetical protein [bacterium]